MERIGFNSCSCGGNAYLIPSKDDTVGFKEVGWVVQCSNCHKSTDLYPHGQDAINFWFSHTRYK